MKNKIKKDIKKIIRKNEKLLEEVFSILLVGSLTRESDKINSNSDIDLIIVFDYENNIPSKKLIMIEDLVKQFKKEINLEISSEVFTKFDLLQLISPILMEDYVRDGEILYGQDIKKKFREKLENISDFEHSTFILKRCMFERYRIRKKIVESEKLYNYSLFYNLFKSALLMIKYSTYLTDGQLFTEREKIINSYSEEKSRLFEIAKGQYQKKKNFTNISNKKKKNLTLYLIDLMEEESDKITKIIKRKHPNEELSIPSF